MEPPVRRNFQQDKFNPCIKLGSVSTNNKLTKITHSRDAGGGSPLKFQPSVFIGDGSGGQGVEPPVRIPLKKMHLVLVLN